jgi:2-polyprenyl-3-methyl-5-hydroxy-6-metoxy-1,4-benzoquinol methylase
MDERLKTNLAMWNEMVPIHAASDAYQLDAFLRGENKLNALERGEVGDVRGKSLLHLQCHFGLDTLSWARLGARVTGVDFSDKAIELARSIARDASIDARFVCATVFDAPAHIDEKFDVVFTSYGVLCWLPDIDQWGRVVAHFVKPGGFFYIAEIHPFANIFRNEPGTRGLEFEFSYFREEMLEFPPGPDYADQSRQLSHPSHEWLHKFSDIFNALTGAGLRIEYIHEFSYCPWQLFPFSRLESDGLWHIPGDPIPQLYTLKAAKP